MITMSTVSLESISAGKRDTRVASLTVTLVRCHCIMERTPAKIWKADLYCGTKKNLGSISHAIKWNRILSVTHGRARPDVFGSSCNEGFALD